jgi:hypothetical protein
MQGLFGPIASPTPNGSEQNTLFDTVISAIAKQQQADAIFSFDKWYKRIGLTLIDDFIAQSEEAA